MVVKVTQGVKEQLVKTFAGDNALYIVTPGMENCAELAIKTVETARVKHN